MTQERLLYLIQQWEKGQLAEAEDRELNEWFGSGYTELFHGEERDAVGEALLESYLKQHPHPHEEPETPVRKLRPWRWAAAAAAVMAIAVTGWYFLHERKGVPPVAIAQDILPGGNHAVLTLADGQKVVLDSAGNGSVANQNGVQVIKLDSGQLAYKGNGATVAYNTLSTPRGGQYRIVLPDGSKVWLNAASSLRYPTAFAGKERRIELSGEAYFEVVHNPQKPFVVSSREQTVTVLGTHFDMESYDDNKTSRTTLFQGKVQVRAGNGNNAVLSPGRQSLVSSQTLQVEEPENMEDIIAWKENLISFSSSDIPDLLKQLGRWYDIEVRYKSAPPDWKLSGKISRYTHLSGVVKILNLSGLKCHVEGRVLVVD